MTIREARVILKEMRIILTDLKIYEYEAALGVAIEAIDHWLEEKPFPNSTRYIADREKAIEGAIALADYKGRGEKVLQTYIYDAGFFDAWKLSNNTNK